MTTSNSISENAISFYASGGHAHDGVTSSLIKTNSYSIYDFNPSFIGDNPERRRAQVNNYNSFRQLVVNTINSTVLEPAGIVLQDNIINSRNIISGSITATEIAANTITADNIAANTITASEIAANTITASEIAANTITANEIAAGAVTASELAANIVLVNNYITSNNFNGTIAANGAVTSAGTTGWAVTSFGHAVFDTTFIRGSLSASEVLTPGVDIYSNGTLAGGSFTLYGNGAIVTSSGNFSVDSGGNLYAENATIYGEINATSGSIDGSLVAGTIDSARIVASAFDTVYINQAGTNIPIVIGTLPSGVDMRASGIIVYGGAYTANTHITGGAISTSGTSSANYFIGSGTVSVAAVNSTNLRRRNSDGYFLIEASKRELKKDISTIENSINLIQKLNPVSFRWKDESSYDYYTSEIRDVIKSKKEYGFIAEDVESEISDLAVYESNEDGSVLIPSMWQQNGVIALCVASIKELLSKINTLEGRIQELENEV